MELNTNAAEPALGLGIIYFQEGDRLRASNQPEESQTNLDKAFEHLEEAVERDPTSALGQYYFGAVLYRTGTNEQARIRLERALALEEDFHDVRLVLFNVYAAERDYAAALDQLETYLSEYPDSPQREAVEGMKANIERVLSEQ